ncbi:MAG TPA: hemerythrin domain-containing protein [Polyangia bacterium]|jgi:hemerythrin-like domain-containing protein|nr:hemerythrin domain-containing protein [Polyangia bacterium]
MDHGQGHGNGAEGRRTFLVSAAGAGLALAAGRARAAEAGKKEADLPPTEDLMREHGVLRRILLIYEEAARRLPSGEPNVANVVAGAANVVHRFVEGYHEKLEESFVFPKLEHEGKLTNLTVVLRTQHAAGRKLTEAILAATKSGALSGSARGAVVAAMESFVYMYAPHAAWEDTELFPVYRGLFSEAELGKVGDRFEEQEHKLFGSGGFEGSLRDVGDLEKALGINDLARYTPGK